MLEIAIVGSPNCGKTTIFNRLTGARQRTGNWPGVTVERKDGRLPLPNTTGLADKTEVRVVDLPGIYSLHDDIQGLDARVAHQYLHNDNPALVLVVLDATRLSRQLSLLPSILATGKPVLLVVNMLDSAEAEGIHVDLPTLKDLTGLPVVGVVGSTGQGLDVLKSTIASLLVSYPAARQDIDFDSLGKKVCRETGVQSRTEKIDKWLLHPYLAFPVFLLVMYLLFTIAVNVGAVFIDFFDIVLGAIFVDGVGGILASINTPPWIQAILADG